MVNSNFQIFFILSNNIYTNHNNIISYYLNTESFPINLIYIIYIYTTINNRKLKHREKFTYFINPFHSFFIMIF